MRRREIIITALAAAFVVAATPGAHPQAWGATKPEAVVSVNLCADELVLRLSHPGQVKSVTWLARDSLASSVAALADELPVNRGLAEEIVPLSPDLVVAGIYTTRMSVAFLKRLGIPVMDLGVPGTLGEVRDQIREVAAALGNEGAGAAMIADLDAALKEDISADARPEDDNPEIDVAKPTALVLRPNGFTAGRGSLVDTLLTRAGLLNLAAELQTDRLGQLPLERIVTAKPDVLIINADRQAPASMAQALLDHPALADIKATATVVEVPTRLWTCAGPQLVEAMDILKSAAEQARARLISQPEAVQ